jgi:hypothetical protein
MAGIKLVEIKTKKGEVPAAQARAIGPLLLQLAAKACDLDNEFLEQDF